MIDIGARTASFSATLDRFRQVDPDQDPATFNPGELIEDLKSELDGVKMAIDLWEGEAEAINKRWLEPLGRRTKNLQALAAKLKEHVRAEMVKGDGGEPYKQLPGQAWQVNLQPSPWAVSVSELADMTTFKKYAGYVKVRPAYEWDMERIKQELKAGATLAFAQRTRGTHVRFYAKGKHVKDEEE